jgi:protein SCO1
MRNILSRGTRRPLLVLATLLAAAVPGYARDGLAPQSEAPEPAKNIGFDQRLGEKVPLDLKFTDENGDEVTIGQCIGGKPTILILAYYRCPMLCGEVLAGVLDSIRQMPRLTCGKDFNIVAVSFDPKEKPGLALAKKRYFVNEYGRREADFGWKFLTGGKENIDKLTEAVGFHYEYDRSIKEYNHPSGIMIVTPEGVLSRYLPGIEYLDRGDNGQLLEDRTKTLRLSLVEAGEGQIGTLSDKVFLTCYRYNPHTGKYSANVLLLMRLAGLTTLLIIAGVYARVSWKVPGVRVLVVGILAYATLIPVIMFGRISTATFTALLLAAGCGVIVIGRYLWRAAKADRPAEPVASVGVD